MIPTRNESESIEMLLKQIAEHTTGLPYKFEVIIPDYSKDRTPELARSAAKKYGLDLRVMNVDKPGRGYAMILGVNSARGDAYILMDADISHDPKVIPKFLEEFEKGDVEVVSASRFPPIGWSEEHTFFHYWGNRMSTFGINMLFGGWGGWKLTDTENGYCLFSKKAWDTIALDAPGWTFEAQMFCRMLKHRIPFREISSMEKKRYGNYAKLKVMRVAWKIAARVLLERFGWPKIYLKKPSTADTTA